MKGLEAKIEKLSADLMAAKDDKMMMQGQLFSVKDQASEMIGKLLGEI